MDKEIFEQIKANLLKRKEELEKELSKISQDGQAKYEDIGDDEDLNAQEVRDYSDRLALVAELNKHLDDVNNSLKKIEEKGYGVCKYCKQDINPQRLLARPASSSCVKCKAVLQGEKK